MKKVRLFAVAAALGMFAATVNAAAPKYSKETYNATWGTMEEIVRAEIGGKVILPSPSVVVTKQTRTTENPSTGILGATCYVGLTDQVGKDTNGDGLVDYPILTWGHGSASDDWYYDDLKFFPTINTALYYLGMTGNGLGARFIEPNAAAEKGWIVSSTHTKYATVSEVLAYLEEAKIVELVKDDGDIVEVKFNKTEIKADNADKTVLGTAWTSFEEDGTRYGIDELAEKVVSLFDGSLESVSLQKNYVLEHFAGKTLVKYFVDLNGDAADGAEREVKPGGILVVSEDRYGNLLVENVYDPTVEQDEDGEDVDVAAEFTVGAGAAAKTYKGTVGKVTIYLEEGKAGSETYSKFSTITPKEESKGAKYDLIWNDEEATFEKNSEKFVTEYDPAGLDALNVRVKALIAADEFTFDVEGIADAKGLYYYNNPANTSDKIVVNFDGLNIAGINTTKSTITVEDAWGKELTVAAVKLGTKWYPALSNKTKLAEFVRRTAGIDTATDAQITAIKTAKKYSTITWIDGTKDTEYLPANPLAHYKTQQCTYVTGETAVDAASVVVTNNASEIDTNQYGVHTVELTAKVGETTVGTKDVKVVIAPKYVREYKNGRVTSLKAYHLNGNLYSHTTFDYAAKKSTAVFYNQDGVTAIETQTNDIK